MKRIFRIAMVLALSGAALLYTGCAKDAEVNDLQDQVDQLKGSLNSQAETVAALKTAQEKLTTTATNLQTSLEAVQADLATTKTQLATATTTGTQNTKDIEALTKRVETLEAAEKTIQQSIATINANISKIDDAVKTNASDIKTLNTTLASVQSDLGTVKGQVSTFQTTLAALTSTVDANYKELVKTTSDINVALNAVKTNADETAATLSTALTTISALQSYTYALYTNAEIDAMVNGLKGNISKVDSALNKSFTAKVEALEAKDVELKGLIDGLDIKVTGWYEALTAKDETLAGEIGKEVAARTQAIAEVNKEIEDIKTKIGNIAQSVASLEIDVDSLQLAVNSLKETDEALNDAIEKVADDLTATETKLTELINQGDKANADDIEALTNRVDALETARTALEAKDQEILAMIDKLDSAIVANTAAIAGNASAISTNALNIQDLYSEIAATNKALGELSGTVTAYYKEFTTFKATTEQNVKDLQDKDEALEDALNKVKATADKAAEDIIALTSRVSAIETFLGDALQKTTLKALLDALQDNIDILEEETQEALGELSDRIAPLEELLDTLDGKVFNLIEALQNRDAELAEAITNEITNRTKAIDDLKAYVDKIAAGLQGSIDAAILRIVDLEKAVEELKLADETINMNLDLLSEKLSNAKDELAKAIKDSSENNATKIAALDTRVKLLEAAVALLVDYDESLDSLIQVNAASIVTLQNQVSDNTNDIADLWLQVNETVDSLGKVNGRLEAIESAWNLFFNTTFPEYKQEVAGDFTEVWNGIKGLQDQLDSVKNCFGDVFSKYTALGTKLDSLIKYSYTTSEIDGFVTTLDQKIDRIEDEILAKIKVDSTSILDLKNKLANFKDKYDQYINDLRLSVDQAFQFIQEDRLAIESNGIEISILQGRLDAAESDIKKLKDDLATAEGKIADIAVRPNSISVMPSTCGEYFYYSAPDSAFNSNGYLGFVAKFQVEPKESAATLVGNLDSLLLSFRMGLARSTSQNDTIVVPDTAYCDADGIVTVIFSGKIRMRGDDGFNNLYRYFALSYTGVDAAGTYSITSDYAAAIDVKKRAPEFDQGFYISKDANKIDTEIDTVYIRDTNYLAFATENCYKHTPFKDYKYVHYLIPEEFREEPYLTFFRVKDGNYVVTGSDFEKITGYKLNTVFTNMIDGQGQRTWEEYPYSFNGVKKDSVSYDAYNAELTFWNDPADTLAKYVAGSFYTQILCANVFDGNDRAATNNTLFAKFILEPVEKTFETPSLDLFWNYQYYQLNRQARRSTDTLDKSIPADFKMLVGGQMIRPTWAQFIDNSTAQDAESTFKTSGGSPNGSFYTIIGSDYGYCYGTNAKENPTTAYVDTLKHIRLSSDNSDKYTVKIPVRHDTTCGPRTVTVVKEDEIVGSVTKAEEFFVPDFMKSFLVDPSTDKLYPVFTQGLPDNVVSTKDAIEAAWASIQDLKVVNTDKFTITDDRFNSTDSLKVQINAGKVLYNNVDTIVFTATVFEQPFTFNYVYTVGKLPFKLRTATIIYGTDPNKYGIANGVLKNKVYTIEDLFYGTQVMVDSLNKSNELDGTLYYVDFGFNTTKLEFYPNADLSYNGMIRAYGKEATDSIGRLDATSYYTWGSFNDTTFNVTAKLYVKGDSYSEFVDSVKYTIVTKQPVNYVSHDPITIKKKTGVNETAYLWQGAYVTYVNNNAVVDSNLVNTNDGSFRYTYGNNNETYFEYDGVADWTVTIYDPVQGKDVVIPVEERGNYFSYDSTTAKLTVFKDNLMGTIKITVKSKLHSYLDNGKAQEKDINITIQKEDAN